MYIYCWTRWIFRECVYELRQVMCTKPSPAIESLPPTLFGDPPFSLLHLVMFQQLKWGSMGEPPLASFGFVWGVYLSFLANKAPGVLYLGNIWACCPWSADWYRIIFTVPVSTNFTKMYTSLKCVYCVTAMVFQKYIYITWQLYFSDDIFFLLSSTHLLACV